MNLNFPSACENPEKHVSWMKITHIQSLSRLSQIFHIFLSRKRALLMILCMHNDDVDDDDAAFSSMDSKSDTNTQFLCCFGPKWEKIVKNRHRVFSCSIEALLVTSCGSKCESFWSRDNKKKVCCHINIFIFFTLKINGPSVWHIFVYKTK
jgi:hypothetical protein